MLLVTQLSNLKCDVRFMVPRRGTRRGWHLEAAVKFLIFPKFRAVLFYRLGHVLALNGWLPLAYLLMGRGVRACGAEINPLAVIGPGLDLVHGSGVVIGSEVMIGSRVRVCQNVTIGSGSKPGQPTIGDDVFIGAGAAILGGVRVGNGVVIGANAVVTSDVPDGVSAKGVPARW